MTCNITETEMFDIIKKNFTDDLYNWMKIEFSDVCSSGDVYINKLLDDLNLVYNIKNKTDLSIESKYINYIYDAYKNSYLKGIQPDPLWAD